MPAYVVDSVGNIFIEPADRRGRSSTEFCFPNAPHGAPIRGNKPSDFRPTLLDEVLRVLHREDADAVYRGDRPPQLECACASPEEDNVDMTEEIPTAAEGDTDVDMNVDINSNRAVTSSPSVRSSTLPPSSPPPSSTPPPSSPPPHSSPKFPLRAHSPTWTELMESDELVDEDMHSVHAPPTVTGLVEQHDRPASPAVTNPPRKLITYAGRDRRLAAARRAAEQANKAAGTSTSVRSRPRKIYLARSRQSTRVRAGEFLPGRMTLLQVTHLNVPLYTPLLHEFRPFVDGSNRVVGAYIGGPSTLHWDQLIKYATKAMRGLQLNGIFRSDANEDAFVRVGIEFGVRGPYPAQVFDNQVNVREAHKLAQSEEFKIIAAYQNHLLQRVAPRIHADQSVKMNLLAIETQVHPAFPGSAFTTAEFNFSSPDAQMKRDIGDRFGSLRAITTLGAYSDESGWFLYWHEEDGDRFAITCPPGTTLLVPVSVVRYGFSATKQGETRFVFQQYFDTASGRWVENGFKSDTDFEGEASEAEWAESLFRRKYGRVDEIMRSLVYVNELYV
ncbi:hypothetical protein B0H12DRAFT_1246921 [Mycena haematopus]|nr:hypothetical protein B0H12DRAFT_1246921 [Mycena haematopus]